MTRDEQGRFVPGARRGRRPYRTGVARQRREFGIGQAIAWPGLAQCLMNPMVERGRRLVDGYLSGRIQITRIIGSDGIHRVGHE